MSTTVAFYCGACGAPVNPDIRHSCIARSDELAAAEQRGADRVLVEIAKIKNPQGGGSPIYDTTCIFCGGKPWETIPHDSTCLWLRARASLTPQEGQR